MSEGPGTAVGRLGLRPEDAEGTGGRPHRGFSPFPPPEEGIWPRGSLARCQEVEGS
jgi:hypothetical protein